MVLCAVTNAYALPLRRAMRASAGVASLLMMGPSMSKPVMVLLTRNLNGGSSAFAVTINIFSSFFSVDFFDENQKIPMPIIKTVQVIITIFFIESLLLMVVI